MTLEDIVWIVCLKFFAEDFFAVRIFNRDHADVLPAFIGRAETNYPVRIELRWKLFFDIQVEQPACVYSAVFGVFCMFAKQDIAAVQILHEWLKFASRARKMTVYYIRAARLIAC